MTALPSRRQYADRPRPLPTERTAEPGMARKPDGQTAFSRVVGPDPQVRAVADPLRGLLADVHLGLGNDLLNGPGGEGLGLALQQHALGSLALGAAGFQVGELSPTSGSLDAMRQVLRRSQAEAEGLDTERASASIGKRTGQPLPDAVRVRMERAFGHDFGHVRIHIDGAAADAATALNAMAFAIGRDIYFGRGAWAPGTPSGDELLAHELTHVVQADENRLPSAGSGGMDVSSPTDRHEREAVEMGRSVARTLGGAGSADLTADIEESGQAPELGEQSAVAMPGLETMGEGAATDSGLGDESWWSDLVSGGGTASAAISTEEAPISRDPRPTAARPTAQGTPGQSTAPAAAGQQNPDATLTLAGRQIRIPRAAGTAQEPSVNAQVNVEVLPGVFARSARLVFDGQGAVVSGTLTVDVTLGEHLSAPGIELTVGEGGRVTGSAENIALRLTEQIQATVSLAITEDGVSGRGELGFDQIGLPASLGIAGGTVQVEVDGSGIRGAGDLTGAIGTLGTVQAHTRYAEGAFAADVDITVTPGTEPVPGVRINTGTLHGSWAQGQEGLALEGQLDLAVREWLTGTVTATLDAESQRWGISGQLNQVAELNLGELGAINSVLTLTVVDNVPTVSTLDLDFTAPRVEGHLNGAFDIVAHTITATGNASLNADWPIEVGFGTFTLLQGGALSATVTDNVLTEVTGTTQFRAEILGATEVPLVLEGGVDGTYTLDVGSVTGSANAALMVDLPLQTGEGGDQLVVLTGTSVRAELAENVLQSVSFDAQVRYDREGEPFLSGQIPDGVYDVASGALSCTGQLTLLQEIERQSAGGDWTFRIREGAQLDASIESNMLTRVGGSASFDIDDVDGPLLNGRIEEAEIKLDEEKLSGSVAVQTSRAFTHPRSEGGLIAGAPGWLLEVQAGSGAHGQLVDNELTQLGAELLLQVSDPEGVLANMRAVADWDLETDIVNGSGEATLAREVVVAEGMGPEAWSVAVLEGATATGHIEENVFTKVTGGIKAEVRDGEGAFVAMEGGATWTVAEEDLDMTAQAEITREKQLAGTADGWELSLQEGGSATATLTDNELEKVDGSIESKVKQAGEDFANLSLQGAWTPADGLTGKGAAELLVDQDVAQVGAYHLWLEKGAGAELEVEQSSVKAISGAVPIRLDEAETPFIKGNVEGRYAMDERLLSGTGSAEVLVEKQLAAMASGDQLWLTPGSGATVTLADNDLTEIGGNIQLSTRDGEGEYAKVSFNGRFDAAGGTGFSGEGSVTVVREKQLFAVDNYSFWLKEGAGATAIITENKLVEIGGNVPFMVKDGQPEPLIEGSVAGKYDPETGKINGDGAVFLGRDIMYDLGGGTQIKFLKGSGGDAAVVDSQLTRLGGTLTAQLITGGSPLAEISANGTYNAVTNTLEELTGEATLLRPFEVLGGRVIISEVHGTGTIRENQLVSLGGDGKIAIPSLNNMEGTFNVQWSNESGRDVYEGSGHLDFTLFDDPTKGRSMTGEVDVAYHADDTFEVGGSVSYNMNELLKDITVGVQMNQELDPALSIDATVQGNLVEARDLFAREMDLVPHTAVPIWGPFGLFFGLKGGMKMSLDDLAMTAHIGVSDWHPIAENSEVPNFSADLDLTWGMDFNAKIAPYVGIEGNLRVARLGAGVRGEAALDVPVSVNPHAHIEGGAQGFRGELGVGVSIKPTVTLGITPFVEASIVGLDPWTHDFPGFQQNLGEVMSFEWGTKYVFGDTSSRTAQSTTPVAAGGVQQQQTEHRGVPNLGIGNSSAPASNTKGGPQLESGSQLAGEQGTGDPSLDRLLQMVDQIKTIAEGVGALGELMGMIAGIITAGLTFGPPGLIIYLVWKIFRGEISWDGIKAAVQKVVAALQTCRDLLQDLLPDWFNFVVDMFNGRKPGLLDALFGADDRMREAVGRGDHRLAPIGLHKDMIDTMNGGWVSSDDARCIAQILEVSGSRGELNSLLGMVGGAECLLNTGWTESFDDEPIKRVYRRYGIRY